MKPFVKFQICPHTHHLEVQIKEEEEAHSDLVFASFPPSLIEQVNSSLASFGITAEDYAEFLSAWRASAPVPKPKSLEEIKKELDQFVEEFLDTAPKERDFAGIVSLCSYALSTNPKWQAEALAGIAWRDQVYSHCNQVIAEVLAGTRPVPTKEQLLAELPKLVWP